MRFLRGCSAAPSSSWNRWSPTDDCVRSTRWPQRAHAESLWSDSPSAAIAAKLPSCARSAAEVPRESSTIGAIFGYVCANDDGKIQSLRFSDISTHNVIDADPHSIHLRKVFEEKDKCSFCISICFIRQLIWENHEHVVAKKENMDWIFWRQCNIWEFHQEFHLWGRFFRFHVLEQL
jgi:hypothetical protein